MAWKIGKLEFELYKAQRLAEFFECTTYEVFNLGNEAMDSLWLEFCEAQAEEGFHYN